MVCSHIWNKMTYGSVILNSSLKKILDLINILFSFLFIFLQISDGVGGLVIFFFFFTRNKYDKSNISNLLLNFRSTVYKFMVPKVEVVIPDEFYEGDEQSPWVRSVDYQSL